MTKYKHIFILLFFLSIPLIISAQKRRIITNDGRYKKVYSWSNRTNSYGLHTKGKGSGHILTLEFGLNQYFGDVEFPGLAMVDQNSNNWDTHLGFYGELSYMIPIQKHLGLRFHLLGGKLNGNNFKYLEAANQRKEFSSFIAEPDITIQYYPFSEAGKWFYIFGGIGATYSNIAYTHFGITEKNVSRFTPTIPVGLGVDFPISNNFTIGLEVDCHQTLIDNTSSSLDGYPFINPSGETSGKQSKWADGYFTAGIKLSYIFKNNRNCATCRFDKY